MLNKMLSTAGWVAVLGLASAVANAATVPFTESFDANADGWTDSSNLPIGWVASGGADGGGYASTTFDYSTFVSPFGGGPIVARANGANDPSGGAFVGDWIADGVLSLTANVRHDAAVPLTFSVRLAPALNSPGTNLIDFTPVLPNVWTEVTFLVTTAPGLCVFERPGGCTLAGFQDVVNVQLATDAPAGAGLVTLDFDAVSLNPVPEPGTALLMGLGLAGLSRAGRKEKRVR